MDFEMKAGDTRHVYLTCVDKTGEPVNLTDSQLKWWASRGDTTTFSRTPKLMKSLGDGIEAVMLAVGQCRVVLAPEDTRDLAGSFYHELEVIDSFGNVSTPIFGSFQVTKDLIR